MIKKGYSRVASFLANFGFKNFRLMTSEQMIEIAARVFEIPPQPDLASMAAAIEAVPRKHRRLLARRYRKQNCIPHPQSKKHEGNSARASVSALGPDLKLNKPVRQPRRPSASPSPSQIRDFYASWEWKRLSYLTKSERGRLCECCGAAAPAVRIHTDHIKPIRRYWDLRLDPNNLQILCEDCNMGKGSHDETDWRSAS